MNPRLKNWRIWTAGLAGGLFYVIAESLLEHYAGESILLSFFHDTVELFIPVLIGLSIAAGAGFFQGQKDLNRRLSTELTHFKSRLLTHTFASYILHEIRNPIHNLSAVIDKPDLKISDADRRMLERNIGRLEHVTRQLRHLSIMEEDLNIEEGVILSRWLDKFISDSWQKTFRKSGIRFESHVPDARLKMHPLLFEQCFTLLLDNATTACLAERKDRRRISIHTDSSDNEPTVRITIRNSGRLFPDHILQAAGHYMVDSSLGSGLGLVLVRDTLKQVGGDLSLKNHEGMAQVTLSVPREAA